jgi:D-xylose transport system permease protein
MSTTDQAPSPARWTALRGLDRVNWSSYGILVGIIVIGIAFNAMTGGLFLSPRNVTLLAVQAVILGMAACGMVLIMVSGHIDLSVGSAVGLTTTITVYTQVTFHWSAPAAIVAALVVGLLIGIWQGTWIAVTGIPAFVVTLAGMTLLRGVTYLVTNGQTFAPVSPGMAQIANGFIDPHFSLILIVVAAAIYIGARLAQFVRRSGASRVEERPSLARELGRAIPLVVVFGIVLYIALSYQGIPYAVLVLAAVALGLSFIAMRTRFGRHLYAMGGGKEAALLAGINVARNTFAVFVGMGLIYGLAGVVLASRLNGAPPDPALGLELQAITAVIIGGTSLMGGVGTIQGAILGAVLLTSINNGMDLMGLSSYLQFVVEGLILLLAVLLDRLLKRRRGAA